MKQVTNFPLFNGCLEEYGGMAGVMRDYCDELGLDGLEVIWDHMPYTDELPPEGRAIGHHLMFWAHWVDFWNGDQEALLKEYETQQLIEENFHGLTQDDLTAQLKVDVQRAVEENAEYIVFHVSDVSLTECFTYDFKHSDKAVIDASVEFINSFMRDTDFTGALLVENQWWPGFTFTDPAMTRYLLEGIEYPNKGIMLDTGHLMSTNVDLRSQKEAADYIRRMFDAHGELGEYVRGLHLHKSLSGEYVKEWNYRIPDDLTGSYWDKFARTYQHVQSVDRHEPWDDPAVADLVRYLDPQWVNHELSAWPREPHMQALRTQLSALRG